MELNYNSSVGKAFESKEQPNAFSVTEQEMPLNCRQDHVSSKKGFQHSVQLRGIGCLEDSQHRVFLKWFYSKQVGGLSDPSWPLLAQECCDLHWNADSSSLLGKWNSHCVLLTQTACLLQTSPQSCPKPSKRVSILVPNNKILKNNCVCWIWE